MILRTNVAGQVVGAQLVSAADGSAFTGAVTCHVTIDGGTQAPGSVGSGACAHEGNGYHTYAPAQAETNGVRLAYTFVGTGAVPRTVQGTGVSFNPADATALGLSRLDAAISTLATAANLSTVAGYLDTEIADILADTVDIQSRLPAALISGRMDVSVGAMAANVLTATAINADAITAAKIAADVTTEIQSGLATAASITALDGKVGTVTNLGSGATLSANLVDIEAQTDDIGAAGAGLTALATAAELAKVPKSDGTATWNATALASLQQEATDALNAYDPPTNAEMTARTLAAASYATAAALQVVDDELAIVDGVADAILADTGTDGVIVATVNDKTGYAIAAGGIGSAAFAAGAITAAALDADAVDEILDEPIGDSTITMRQALKLLVASLSGKLSGVGTGTITIRNAADTADVIVATVSGGNRTAVTRTL